MSPHETRRRKLARGLTGVHALLVSHPVNVTYLTGFTGEASWLVVPAPRRGQPVLVSDGRFTEQLAEECPGLDVIIRPTDRTIHEEAARVLDRLGHRDVGFESTHLTVADAGRLAELLPAANWSPQAGRVEALRKVKDAYEVQAIRAAVAVAERAFAMFRLMFDRDDTERGLADALEAFIRKAGAECAAFPPIAAGGPRSALPHAPPTGQSVRESPFLLLDWGVRLRGYHSDLTRVLLVGLSPPEGVRLAGRFKAGRVETTLAGLYTVVRSAQQAAIRAIRPGAKASDVDAAARSVIADAGFAAYFNHGLGHGIGLQVHEGPFLRANSSEELAAGMVVTVEPGVYLPGLGGVRIEDDVLVTPGGCEVLSRLPSDPGELAAPG